MAEVKIAAQVYSVRGEAEKDFPGTMKALKECGYEGVELAGLYGHSPEEIRDWLQEQELVPVSAHVGLDLFQQDLEGTVAAYRTIGCRYIGIPYLPGERLPGGSLYEETCSLMREISHSCREKGMILLYHNHTFEFEKTPSGTFVLEEIYQSLGAEETADRTADRTGHLLGKGGGGGSGCLAAEIPGPLSGGAYERFPQRSGRRAAGGSGNGRAGCGWHCQNCCGVRRCLACGGAG